MAFPLAPVRARVEAIVLGALGADGSLGPDAARVALGPIVDPVTLASKPRFQPAPKHAFLRDPGVPAGAVDRAVEFTWPRMGGTPGPSNPYMLVQHRMARLIVSIGYVYGPSLAPQVYLWPNEVAAAVVELPSDRAQGDGERLTTALEFPGLYEAAPATDPYIYGITRESDTEWVDLTGGRSLGVTAFRIALRLQGVYDP